MNRLIGVAVLTSACVALGGCATSGAKYRPIVDGSDPEKYEVDLAACQRLAEDRSYVNPDLPRQATIGAAVHGVFNGAAGAVAGAVLGGGRAAARTVHERKAIVINCMEGRGHKVVESRYSR